MAGLVWVAMTPPAGPRADQAPYADVANCSILFGGEPIAAAHAAAAAGWSLVEFWWPFPVPDPAPAEIDAFAAGLDRAGVRLIAVNLWGGDLGAGERGVLHRADPPPGHLAALRRLHGATGVAMGNLLPGAGGPEPTAAQEARIAAVVEEVGDWFTPLLEPLSGDPRLPLRDPRATAALAERTGAGVLADLYHLAANGVDVDAWLGDLAAGRAAAPAHVQVADAPGRGAPGTGAAPLGRWVRALRAAGYAGHVAAEWDPS